MAYNQYDEDYGDYDDENPQGDQVYDYNNANTEYYNPPNVPQEEEIPLPPVRTHEEILQAAPRREIINDREFDEENLGEDFEETPWQPPSIEKAVEYRSRAVFRGGNASTCGTTVCKAPDLGIGTALYFQFQKSMAVCFFIMFVFSIPSLIFCFFGQKIPVFEQDKLGLYRFMIGNIGYDPTSLTYQHDSGCHKAAFVNSNETCLHIPYLPEISLTQASSVVTAFEFLQILVFFIGVFHLQRRADSLTEEVERLNTSVTDYTVMVRHLPEDTTVEQLVAHFSSLYPLDRPDWQKRPLLIGARPVQPISKTGFAGRFHLNTWVAECTLFRKIGEQLAAFKAQELLTKTLHLHRATMKMYAEDTPHGSGANPRKYERAEKRMIETGATIDLLAEKVIQKKLIHHSAASIKEGEKHAHDVNAAIEADAVAAFVTFEYSESFARCIEDHEKYSRFPRNLCVPAALRFRGSNITVTKAPEPDSVVWENLETTYLTKRFKRGRTTVVALLLLIVAFYIILQASLYKQKSSKTIPPLSMCQSRVKELFNVSTALQPQVQLVGAPAGKIMAYNTLCNNVMPNSFYAVYVNQNRVPVANYSWSVCSSSQGGLCPSKSQKVHCPCITTTNAQSRSSSPSCSTAACTTNQNDPKCVNFQPSLMGGCYCMAILTVLLKKGESIVSSGGKGVNIPPQCNNFAAAYAQSTGATYLATLLTVILNYILAIVMQILTKYEAHSSVAKEESSLALKLFVCAFFNMGILALFAFGRPPNVSETVRTTFFIFNGEYSDFDPLWYPVVGNFLVVTFMIQVISPWVYPLVSYYITYPLERCLNYPMISMQRSHKVAMQDQLNEMEVGPVFDTSSAIGQALSLLFFAMLYAPGIPVLMLVAFLAFVINFSLEKMLICRFYQRPPNVDDGIIRSVLRLLPYAAIMRLFFAIWMFSNPNIFPSTLVSGGTLDSSKATNSASKFGVKGASSYGGSVSTSAYSDQLQQHAQVPSFNFIRVYQSNVLPLLVLLVLIIAAKLIRKLWKVLPIYWLMKFVAAVAQACCGHEKKVYPGLKKSGEGGTKEEMHAVHPYELQKLEHHLRQEAAPFTGEYFVFLKDKNEIPTTCLHMCNYDKEKETTLEEAAAGWVVIEDDDFFMRKQLWTHTATIGGVTRIKGEIKRTYEIIDDHGINSYKLEKIPAYKNAIMGLTEGAKNLQDYAHEEKTGDHHSNKKAFHERYKEKKQQHHSKHDTPSEWDQRKPSGGGATSASTSRAEAGRKTAWADDDDEQNDEDDDDEEN